MCVGRAEKSRVSVTDEPGFCYAMFEWVTVAEPYGARSVTVTRLVQLAAAPDLRRGMPRRWRRSHRHLRLMPSLRASSVSVM